MKLLDTITIRHNQVERFVNLYAVDLAALPADEAVDILIISAFPDDYTPTSRSLTRRSTLPASRVRVWRLFAGSGYSTANLPNGGGQLSFFVRRVAYLCREKFVI